MNKAFKICMWTMIVLGVALLIFGFAKGYPASVADDNGTVAPLLYCAYAMVGIAVFSALVIGVCVGIANDPKSLVKLGIAIVVVAAVVLLAWILAPGADAIGLVSAPQPEKGTLKLVDTILNLTYITGGIVILAIAVDWVLGTVRK